MYNILLTDDEQIVNETLSLILNRNFGGEVKIFTALSGSKAIEIIRTEKIDIIFMDIHMPGINGLETISLIKQINPNIIIVILSAFDQFQYAQQALNLGAFKYLTKPVNRNIIIQSVRECMNLVDSKRGAISDNIQLHEKLNIVSSIVESDFIYSCMFSDSTADFSTYLDYFNIAGLPYFMGCIDFFQIDQDKRYDVYMKTRDILTSKGKCVIGSFMTNKIGFFYSLPKDKDIEKQSKESLNDVYYEEIQHSIAKSIYSIISTNITSKVRIGVGSIEKDIQKSSLAYKNALSALNSIELEGGLAFYLDLVNANDESFQLKKINALLSKIESRFKVADISAVNILLVEYIDLLFDLYKQKMDLLKNKLLEFIFSIRSWTIQVVSDYFNNSFDNSFKFISLTEDKTEIIQFINDRVVECISEISMQKDAKEHPIIKKACAYIEKNLCFDIGLEQLAEYLNLSSFYLSKLFKEEKGCNFITYLTDCRLEKAKTLLRNDSLIIKEVSKAVGYNDQNYFSKAFKQKFGLSPREYKESLGEKEND